MCGMSTWRAPERNSGNGSRFKVSWSAQQQVERWITEGRGQGHGADYRPWLKAQDVLSKGHAHKVPGLKVPRLHHVFSDLEAHCLRLLEFQPEVLDIREQFPLLPPELTRQAAKRLGLRHPVHPASAISRILTSDFCVDVCMSDHRLVQIAIAVKYSQDLFDRRTRELLSIEREANAAAGRLWLLFTETTVSSVVLHNLAWLRRNTLSNDAVNESVLREFGRCFRGFWKPDLTLQDRNQVPRW